MAKNNRRNNKGNNDKRKPNTKGKPSSKDDESGEIPDKEKNASKGYNDAKLYIPDEGIRKQIGSFSFNNVIGLPVNLVSSPEGLEAVENKTLIPSVMAVGLYPGLDPNSAINYGSSAINVASSKLYAKLSALSGRTANYQPQDLAMAIMDIGDLCSMISNFQRAYGVLFNFNPRNRDIPEALIEGMGFDYKKFRDNIPNLRMKFNSLMVGANNIRFPKDINYFTKCWQVFQHVFIDENSSMAQYYVMKPMGHFVLDETGEEGSELVWNPLADKLDPMNYLQLMGQKIDAILTSTTYNYVFTDVLNYVTKQGGDLIGFGYLNELYPLDFKYDVTFMNQLHNMFFLKPDLSNYKIKQDPLTNSIYATDWLDKTWLGDTFTETQAINISGDQLIDLPFTDTPDPDTIIDALAFKQMVDRYDSDSGIYFLNVVPDHMVGVIKIYRKYFDGTLNALTFESTVVKGDVSPFLLKNYMLFTVKPLLYVVGDSNKDILGDLNYFTVVKPTQMTSILYYYYLGLFDTEIKVSKQF